MRVLTCLGIGAAFAAAFTLSARASTPPSDDVTVPTADGQVTTVTWTGTVLPGAAGANNTCVHTSTSDPTQDHHLINLTVPPGTYQSVNVSAVITIDIDPSSTSDLVLTLEKNGAKVADSDSGSIGEGESVM